MLNNNTITTLCWRKLVACAQFRIQNSKFFTALPQFKIHNSKFIITKKCPRSSLEHFFIVYADCTNFSSSITSLLVFVFGCSHLRIL